MSRGPPFSATELPARVRAVLGTPLCAASLSGALAAAAVGARVALSRRGFVGQLVLALVTTLPLCLLDVLCFAALLVLRLAVVNLWLPLWLMRRCADRFEERLLREERG